MSANGPVKRRSASPPLSARRGQQAADRRARESPSPPQRTSPRQPESVSSSSRPASRSSPADSKRDARSTPHPQPGSSAYASIPQTAGPVAGPSTVSVGHGRPTQAGSSNPASPAARASATASSSPVLGVRTAGVNGGPIAGPSSSTSSGSASGHTCAKCGQPMTGQFVRALGLVFHLNCFTCGTSSDPERGLMRRRGLQQGRRGQVLPGRRSRRSSVPALRDGLFQVRCSAA